MKKAWLVVACWAVGLAASRDASALFVQQNVNLWPDGIVPVCWAHDIDPQGGDALGIREQIELTWARYGNLRFTGWGRCETADPRDMPDGPMIFIVRTSGRPNAGRIGMHISQVEPHPIRPNVMRLNFDPGWRSCNLLRGVGRRDCIRHIAVHEFGHALGFLHEHARKDFKGCGLASWLAPVDDIRRGGGDILTTMDYESVMSLCSDGGENGGQLSPRDIAGLQIVYGRKPEGAIVTRIGQCVGTTTPSETFPDGGVTIRRCASQTSDDSGEQAFLRQQQWGFDVAKGSLEVKGSPSLCLDTVGEGFERGSPVHLSPCARRDTSRWFAGPVRLRVGGQWLFTDRFGFILSDMDGFPEFLPPRRGLVTPPDLRLVDATWTFDTFHRVIEHRTSKCMDAGNARPSTPVTLQRCDVKKPSQRFSLLPSGQIRTQSGRCLELGDGGGFLHARDKQPLIVGKECKDTQRDPEQKFRYGTRVMDQLFTITGPIRATGANCIERRSPSPRLFMQKCGSGGLQVWDYYFADPRTVDTPPPPPPPPPPS